MIDFTDMRRVVGWSVALVLVAGVGVGGGLWLFPGEGASEGKAETAEFAATWSDEENPVAITPDESPETRREEPAEAASETETKESKSVERSPERAEERSRGPAETQRRVLPGQQRSTDDQRREYKPAVLRVVTNFKKADVTVNGLPYPEYKEQTNQKGMVLPAGGPYHVKVTYNGKSKNYSISLEPYQTRILMVELSGFKGGSVKPAATASPKDSAKATSQNNNQEEGNGRVTVYSKPKGQIHVDGEPRDQETPGTVEVPAGQHDIQVKFKNGKMSESKTVRVRKGSRIKLFFRKRE